jgi:hypothetical protein
MAIVSILSRGKIGADDNIFSKETFSGALSRCYSLTLIILDKPSVAPRHCCEACNTPICLTTAVDSLSHTFVADGAAAIAVQMLDGS